MNQLLKGVIVKKRQGNKKGNLAWVWILAILLCVAFFHANQSVFKAGWDKAGDRSIAQK